MNPARMESIVQGLTGTASKVYEAVPIMDRWTVDQVCRELGRHGLQYAYNQVRGCLRSLKEQGLIRENSNGWQRIEPKVRMQLAGDETEHEEEVAHTMDPMSKLALLAAELREQAAQLIRQADALDATAIEVAESMERSGEDGAKLRQLRDLLGSLAK